MKTNTPIPVQEAAKDNPEIIQMLKDLEEGRIFPCSPFPGMDQPWSEAEKESLGKALDEIFKNNDNSDFFEHKK